MQIRGWLAWMLGGLIAVASPGVRAQPALDEAALAHGEGRPWAKGVSEADQRAALALYTEGNQEFVEQHYVPALAKYREALAHWDHPAIRYNIAIVLDSLEQPLEARDNLVRSLGYGAAALGDELYKQGVERRDRLEARLARLTIGWPGGASLMVDGKPLAAENAIAMFLLPGAHQIVATKPQFLTLSQTVVLEKGKLASYDVVPTLALVNQEVRPALQLRSAAPAAAPAVKPAAARAP